MCPVRLIICRPYSAVCVCAGIAGAFHPHGLHSETPRLQMQTLYAHICSCVSVNMRACAPSARAHPSSSYNTLLRDSSVHTNAHKHTYATRRTESISDATGGRRRSNRRAHALAQTHERTRHSAGATGKTTRSHERA